MKVLIVGAGPAGVTLALLLARRDIQVTLVERETDFARVFRGEALMPLGVDALYQMGLKACSGAVYTGSRRGRRNSLNKGEPTEEEIAGGQDQLAAC